MKLNSVLIGGALSLGLVSLASAQNYVTITGSTAFRPAVYDALATATFDSAPTIAAYKCSTVGSIDPHTAGQMRFSGLIGGASYIIKCSWSGSEAGIADVVTSGKTENFIDDSVAAGVSTSTASATDARTVDLAFADTSQKSSKNPAPPATALKGNKVGIIPFVWVKNAQTGTNPDYDRLTNVTDPQLRVMLAGGSPLAMLTGNPADTKWVYIYGRDDNSGTRVNALGDTGYGIKTPPQQILIGGASGSPSLLIDPLGSGQYTTTTGESSGGTLASHMTWTGSATAVDQVQTAALGTTVTGWYAVAYIGAYDADVSTGGNAKILTYNGSSYDPNNAATYVNLKNGTYSFWGQEWLYLNPTVTSFAGTLFQKLTGHTAATASTSGPKITAGSAINTTIDNTHAFQFSVMAAAKTGDVSDPTHN